MSMTRTILSVVLTLSISNVQATSLTTDYRYNAYSDLSNISYTSTNGTQDYTFRYFNSGALKEVDDGLTTVYTVDEVDKAGNVKKSSYRGNTSATSEFSYDSFGRLLGMSLKNNNNFWYSGESAGYDVSGFIKGWNPNGVLNGTPLSEKQKRYQYNSLGQLEHFFNGNASVNYQYDGQGNLVSHNAIDAMKPLLTQTFEDGYHRDGFAYDELGRLIEDETYRYFYDKTSRLKLIRNKISGEIVEAYRYDASGKRVSSYRAKSNEVVINRIGVGGEILEERNVSFESLSDASKKPYQVTDYSPIGGNHVKVSRLNKESGYYETTEEWRFRDRMGNPVLKWDSSNQPLKTEYSPYGQQLVQSEESKHRGSYGYTGVHSEDETGLIYMQARYQSPNAGRFLTPDPARDVNPLNPSSYNLYRYTSNNPVNLFDPSGLVGLPVSFRAMAKLMVLNDLGVKRKYKKRWIGLSSHPSDKKRSYVVRVVEFKGERNNKIRFQGVSTQEKGKYKLRVALDSTQKKGRKKRRKAKVGDILIEEQEASYRKLSSDRTLENPMATNCHGTTFCGSMASIDNSEVKDILVADGYKEIVDFPMYNDKVVYYDDGDNVVHSATVFGFEENGDVLVIQRAGLGTELYITSLKEGWKDAATTRTFRQED